MTLDELTIDAMRPRLNETFRLMAKDGTLELVLAEAQDLGESLHRRAFSLIFSAPQRPVMPQASYRLDNDALGAVEMFLVPLGPEKGVFRYQAIFT